MNKRILIIGAGAVGAVVASKCAQNSDVFSAICIASHHVEKCTAIVDGIK